MVAKIPLTQGLFALVDDEDAKLCEWFTWTPRRHHGNTYAVTFCPKWLRGEGVRSSITMHRLLTGQSHMDHANGDGLDNRRENLRRATPSENQMNRRKWSTPTSSEYKGVSWDKNKSRFYSYFRIPDNDGGRGRRKFLGYFADELDAAHAYDTAAREYYGEYAALNFPLPGERSALTGEIIPLESEAA